MERSKPPGEQALKEVLEWHSRQEIGIGQRSIEVSQEMEAPSGNDPTLLGRVRFHFDITKPLLWQCSLGTGTAAQLDKFRIQAKADNNTTIEFHSDRDVGVAEVDEAVSRVQARLPSGVSLIEITVRSKPYYEISETAVLCRPDQLAEAAVVLSCLGSRQYLPLVVVEEPPMSEEEYTSLYLACTKAKKLSLQTIGGLGAAAIKNQAEAMKAVQRIDRHWELQKQLTPYRSWVKRNEGLGQLFEAMGVRRFVFLFPMQEADFPVFTPEFEAEARARGAGASVLPPGSSIVHILPSRHRGAENDSAKFHFYESGDMLTTVACSALGQVNASRSKQSIRVKVDDPLAILSGLAEALRRRVPLEVTSDAVTRTPREFFPSTYADSEETVIVEATGHANDLVGILYAHHGRRGLVLTGRPDLSEIHSALQELNDKQAASAKASLLLSKLEGKDVSRKDLTAEENKNLEEVIGFAEAKRWSTVRDSDFVGMLRRFVLGDWADEAIQKIERAVLAQVPEFLPEAVGNNAVTAFTTGLPYSFARFQKSSWEKKAIGHVISDPSLMILRELYIQGAPRSMFGLSLIVDPGFFPEETKRIRRPVAEYFTHPLVLERETASLAALQHLSSAKGLEFVFFNTHGTDHSIVLGSAPLKNYEIPQWLVFPSCPIIFNNSCISWQGVGREFVRIGARGYIGTLWSVNAKQASAFAQAVTRAAANRNVPISEAISRSTVQPMTRRAYIYIGTASGRLDSWIDESPDNEWEYVRAGSMFFLNKLGESLEYLPQLQTALAPLFFREVQLFAAHLETMKPLSQLDLLNARYRELSLIGSEAGIVLRTEERYERSLVEICRDRAAAIFSSREVRDMFGATLVQFSARLRWRRGDLQGAMSELQSCSVSPDDSVPLYASIRNLMIEISKRAGDFKTEKELAVATIDRLENYDAALERVPFIGQICQLCKRTGDVDRGLEYARRGFSEAADVGEPERQAVFKLDEAQLLIHKAKWEEAIAAARLASKMFRVQHDLLGDAKAHGTIGNCLLNMGDFGAAKEVFDQGYRFARELGDAVEIAAFATDLGNVAIRVGDVSGAFHKYLEALGLYVKLGQFEGILQILGGMIGPCLERRDYELFGRVLCCQLLLVGHVGPQLANQIIQCSFIGVKDLLAIEHSRELASSFRAAWQFGDSLVSSNDFEPKEPFRFMMSIFGLMTMWIYGDSDVALATAKKLDAVSGSRFNFLELVGEPF